MTALTLVQPEETVEDSSVAGAGELVLVAAHPVVDAPSVADHQSTSLPRPRTLVRVARRLQRAGSDAGMTTAEYAIGTVAACGFGGVLIKLLTSDTVVSLLSDLIRKALTLAF